jgi:hypothetical protein
MTIPSNIIPGVCASAIEALTLTGRLSPPDKLGNVVFRYILSRVWRSWLRTIEDHSPDTRAEGVVAECIRRGVDKKDIFYSWDLYELHLPEGSYFISRDKKGYGAWPMDRMDFRDGIHNYTIPKEVFADFLFSFDRLIPEIVQATDDTIGKLREVYQEQQKENLIREIRRQQLQALLEERLSSLGLTGFAWPQGFNGENFTLNVQNAEGKEWTKSGTFPTLCRLLQDSGRFQKAVRSRLR